MKIRVAIAAWLFAASFPAYAQTGKYTIDFPKGWSAPTTADGAEESRAPSSLGDVWCRANSNNMPSLATVTQTDINTMHGAAWDTKTWSDVITVPADKMQISAGVSTQVDGHLVQKVTVAFSEDVFGAKVTGRFVSHVLVGRMVNAACFSRSDAFDSLLDLFEKTVSSLRPA